MNPLRDSKEYLDTIIGNQGLMHFHDELVANVYYLNRAYRLYLDVLLEKIIHVEIGVVVDTLKVETLLIEQGYLDAELTDRIATVCATSVKGPESFTVTEDEICEVALALRYKVLILIDERKPKPIKYTFMARGKYSNELRNESMAGLMMEHTVKTLLDYHNIYYYRYSQIADVTYILEQNKDICDKELVEDVLKYAHTVRDWYYTFGYTSEEGVKPVLPTDETEQICKDVFELSLKVYSLVEARNENKV